MNKTRSALALTAAAALAFSLAACSTPAASVVAADCEPAHEFSTVADGTLTVAATPVPPFSIVENDEVTGVDGDLLRAFAESECLDITVMPLDFAGAVPAIQSDRADVASGAFYRTKARTEVVDMTDPIYLDEMAIVSNDGIDSIDGLEGLTVGTGDGFLWTADLQTALGDGVKVYPGAVELFADLEAGRIDAVVESYGVGLSYVEGTEWTVAAATADDRVLATTQASQIGIPYAKTNTDLGAALDAFLAEKAADGTIVELLEKYGLPASAAEVGEPRLL